MKVSYQHLIPAPIEKVLAAFGSREFYQEKQKASGALSVECLKYDDNGAGQIKMSHRCSEPSRLPSFIRKSDVDTYVDDITLDSKERRMTWKVTPASGADKFFLSGEVRMREAGEHTEITYTTDLEVKIPLVGKKAEKIALAQTEEETAKQAAFLKSWVTSH